MNEGGNEEGASQVNKEERYDPTIREELGQADWESVLIPVLKYAHSRAKKFHWLGFSVEPEEMVNEAVSRAYGSGTGGTYRNWNREKYPRLEDFLISIIASMTSHQAEHAERFKMEPLTREDGTQKDLEDMISPAATGSHYPITPEEEILLAEGLESISSKLYDIAEGDEDMGSIVVCLEDGISRPREIAKATGLDKKVVNNKLRTLRRKLKEFRPVLR